MRPYHFPPSSARQNMLLLVGSLANSPMHAEVHVVDPGFSTPRAIMHRCAARHATITPDAPVAAATSLAMSRVRRS